MGDQLFRIASTSEELIRAISATAADHIHTSDALLGFYVAEGDGGLLTLHRNDGECLGRFRSVAQCVASLRSLLSAFVAPAPSGGSVRFAGRVLRTSPGRYALLGPDSHLLSTLAERRIDRHGLAIVDTVAIDIAPSGEVTGYEMPGNHEGEATDSVAHGAASQLEGIVHSLVLPTPMADAPAPSPAITATVMARATRSGSRRDRLDLGLIVASSLDLNLASVSDPIWWKRLIPS